MHWYQQYHQQDDDDGDHHQLPHLSTAAAAAAPGAAPAIPSKPPPPPRPWSPTLHRQFVHAIMAIGLEKCSPAVLINEMVLAPNFQPTLTGAKMKSHLQKYRCSAAFHNNRNTENGGNEEDVVQQRRRRHQQNPPKSNRREEEAFDKDYTQFWNTLQMIDGGDDADGGGDDVTTSSLSSKYYLSSHQKEDNEDEDDNNEHDDCNHSNCSAVTEQIKSPLGPQESILGGKAAAWTSYMVWKDEIKEEEEIRRRQEEEEVGDVGRMSDTAVQTATPVSLTAALDAAAVPTASHHFLSTVDAPPLSLPKVAAAAAAAAAIEWAAFPHCVSRLKLTKEEISTPLGNSLIMVQNIMEHMSEILGNGSGSNPRGVGGGTTAGSVGGAQNGPKTKKIVHGNDEHHSILHSSLEGQYHHPSFNNLLHLAMSADITDINNSNYNEDTHDNNSNASYNSLMSMAVPPTLHEAARMMADPVDVQLARYRSITAFKNLGTGLREDVLLAPVQAVAEAEKEEYESEEEDVLSTVTATIALEAKWRDSHNKGNNCSNNGKRKRAPVQWTMMDSPPLRTPHSTSNRNIASFLPPKWHNLSNSKAFLNSDASNETTNKIP